MTAVKVLFPRSIVRTVIRFWKTQAEHSLLANPEQELKTSPLPSQFKGQNQGALGSCPLHFLYETTLSFIKLPNQQWVDSWVQLLL